MKRKEIANEIDRRIKKLEETIISREPINKISKIVDALNNAFKEIGNISIRLTNIEKENKESKFEKKQNGDYGIKLITNLEEAKRLTISEHFIFGEYQGEPIEWRKINEHLAISVKILDCIVFNSKPNNKYNESMVRGWCNNVLGKSLGFSEDTIYTLTKEDFQEYFPTAESRQAKSSEWAIMHGIYVDNDGNSPYWTSSPVSYYYNVVRSVTSSGSFSSYDTGNSNLGVRPVLKI